ncbi:MAG: hypothetical protein IAX21_09395 [Candidatus Bathyarchaeota archaeon]|nr:hypothetical protein [Candidatus Bathyarchaeum tardum]WGM88914.1 MAG: hypothetical protein NUK63_08325 [Candidatus Bathyarchaeum tardum]WNZ28847.1 MAG: hypothetical protein IAX21_09395 [Candidatus Bathyarchaeota archaeon]
MGKYNISVKDRLDRRFREEVFKRKGMKKGNLSEAIEEAMVMWIGGKKENEERRDQ